MYKIYINDNPLILTGQSELPEIRARYPDSLTGRYAGQIKILLHYVDHLEKIRQPQAIVLYAADPKQLMRDFFSLFHYLEAAGGLVFNDRQEALFIYRRGRWDLPKGKIDPGETPPQAAVREVQEETGLQEIILGEALAQTLHIYRQKNRRILKRTYWYLMHTPERALTPQTEEDIERAEWVDLPGFLQTGPDCYASIREVVESWLASGAPLPGDQKAE